MEEVTISLATLDDIAQCVLIDTHMGFSSDPTVEQKAIHDHRLFIARIGSKIIGYLRYGYLWDGEMPYLQMIRIEQEYRKMGIGKKLIATLEDELMRQNIKYLLSSTDEANTISLQLVNDPKSGSSATLVNQVLLS